MRIKLINCNIATDEAGLPMQILIEDGLFTQIAPEVMEKADETMDTEGKIIFPGLVDMHCHLREPGYEYKETIATGTAAAALGGFTSVACMANTNPVVDNDTVVESLKKRIAETACIKVYPIGAISKQLKGEQLAEIGLMKRAGIVAVSDDGMPVMNGQLMKLALQYASQFCLPVISHCEDLILADGGVMHEGYVSTQLGLRGISPVAEEAMAARDILLARSLGCHVHIAHVSTKATVALIRAAKASGVHVTCETAPHYLCATDEWVGQYNTNARVNPPLRTALDVEAIIEGLCDGSIDCIATDHAPHHLDDKRVEFNYASSGISGFETAFALCWDRLVKKSRLTPAELAAKMAENPAKILGLNAGKIQCGMPADLTVIDPNESWTIQSAKFYSKGKNTPFDGMTVTGRVCHVMVDGRWVVMDKVMKEGYDID